MGKTADVHQAFLHIAQVMRDMPQDVQKRLGQTAQHFYVEEVFQQLTTDEFAVIVGVLIELLAQRIFIAKHSQGKAAL